MRQHPLVGDIVVGLLKFVGFLVVGAVGLGIGLFSFLQVIGFNCTAGFEERCSTTANPAGWILAWTILGAVTIAVFVVWYVIFRGWQRRGGTWMGAALAAVPIASIVVDELISPAGFAVWFTAFVVVGVAIERSQQTARHDTAPPPGNGQGSGIPPMAHQGG